MRWFLKLSDTSKLYYRQLTTSVHVNILRLKRFIRQLYRKLKKNLFRILSETTVIYSGSNKILYKDIIWEAVVLIYES